MFTRGSMLRMFERTTGKMLPMHGASAFHGNTNHVQLMMEYAARVTKTVVKGVSPKREGTNLTSNEQDKHALEEAYICSSHSLNMERGGACIEEYNYEAAIKYFETIISDIESCQHIKGEDLCNVLLANAYANKGAVQLRFPDQSIREQGKECLKKALELNPDDELAGRKSDMLLFDAQKLPKGRIR